MLSTRTCAKGFVSQWLGLQQVALLRAVLADTGLTLADNGVLFICSFEFDAMLFPIIKRFVSSSDFDSLAESNKVLL